MQGIAGDECGGKLLSWIEYQKLLILLSVTHGIFSSNGRLSSVISKATTMNVGEIQ